MMKRPATLLLLAAALSGCVSTSYRAPDSVDMPPAQARRLVESFPRRWAYLADEKAHLWRRLSWNVRQDGVSFEVVRLKANMKTPDESTRRRVFCRFADMKPELRGMSPTFWAHMGAACPWGPYYARGEDAAAREFLDALVALKDAPPVDDPKEDASFAETLRLYADPAARPAMPETARKHMVRAEAAVREKRFDDAAVEYRRALGLAPWWSAGYFNLALILGEQGRPEHAVVEMKKYLALEPRAEDARQAQDKIYEWGGD